MHYAFAINFSFLIFAWHGKIVRHTSSYSLRIYTMSKLFWYSFNLKKNYDKKVFVIFPNLTFCNPYRKWTIWLIRIMWRAVEDVERQSLAGSSKSLELSFILTASSVRYLSSWLLHVRGIFHPVCFKCPVPICHPDCFKCQVSFTLTATRYLIILTVPLFHPDDISTTVYEVFHLH